MVAHLTIGSQQGEPLLSVVTYHQRKGTDKDDVDKYGEAGLVLSYDDSSGFTRPQPGQPPVLTPGPKAVTWSGLSKIPSRSMHLHSLDQVAGGDVIYRWAPDDYEAHVFVPLVERDDSGKRDGAAYAVALRSETVKLDVDFEDAEEE